MGFSGVLAGFQKKGVSLPAEFLSFFGVFGVLRVFGVFCVFWRVGRLRAGLGFVLGSLALSTASGGSNGFLGW